jgi:hypothetical protein
MTVAEGGQDHPVTEPAAVEGQPSPLAEASSQIGVPQTHIRRVALNVSLSLLIAIGIAFLNNLSTSVKVLFSAASLCSVLLTWFLSLYDKDFKKDFKEGARNFLESRSCTWSLALPAVAVWAINAYFAGAFGRIERRIAGEPVILRVVPAKGVFQTLEGSGALKDESFVLRILYHGKPLERTLDSAGVIYLGSSVNELQAQIAYSDTDDKTVSDAKKQRRDNLKEKLIEYLAHKGVTKDFDPLLTAWGEPQYLDTPVFRAGETVELYLVCPDRHTTMVHIPAFRLSRNQDPVYLECLEEHNPCAPPL